LSERKTRRVTIEGDSTTPIVMDITDEEYRVIRQLAALSQRNSTNSCMPTIHTEEDRYFYWSDSYDKKAKPEPPKEQQ